MGKELSLLEKLEKIIPGFHGYKVKELIREDDRLIRNYIYNELKRARDIVRELMLAALDGMYDAPVTYLDRLWKKLDEAGSKIKNAPAGYAGFFDRVKVRERELETLKQVDAEIASMTENLLAVLQEARSNPAKLQEVMSLVNSILDRIEFRNNLFKAEPGR